MKDLVLNELSTQPYPADIATLHQRIENLLLLCKEVSLRFGIKKLRFPMQLVGWQLLESPYSFVDFLNDSKVKRTTKDLLLSVYRYPFIDETEENQYIQDTFFLFKDNQEQTCAGFAAAYLYDTFAVSLLSESFWEELQISICIKNDSTVIEKNIFHASKLEQLQNENVLTQWLEEVQQREIITIADLKNLYPSYVFENQAFEDLLYWKNQSLFLYERLHSLLKDIELNYAVGGLGKTEPLKHGRKGFSKRRTQSRI